ncbi:tetratricopeptide repeat protein [Daejeonella sp. H1SJ63]|jgi:predicted transcriptional regulator with HTH domain|uniref:tetratricopeptide repeat protein n=1 Tax=Daejeonella sp. H1SJ63 TaxID=3034145 RepID=UPI0023EC0D89|nr:tetratricopeptide repeat protein [Daejeonella sp. H1SJ63]
MVKYRFLILLGCLLISKVSYAKFDFNANCIRAYENILSLKLSTARILINAEKRKNPTNAIPYLLDNYVDYFNLMTTENESDFERLKDSKNQILKRIEKDDKSSPYYLYSLAEINLQLAICRGKAKEYFTAAIEINRAYNLFQENARKFPEFLPNQKGLGMINAALGTLPDALKKLFGIRGDTRTGMRMLESLVERLPASAYSHFYDETVFYLSIIQTDIVIDTANFAKIIKNTDRMDRESLLRTYLRAYAALKSGNSKRTLEELSKRPTEPYYQSYPYLDYLSGMAKMQNLDPSATLSFNNYLKNYKGVNLIKDTYLRLAWLELLRSNTKAYYSYTDAVKEKGYDIDWRDVQAIREVNYPAPDISLLKARLLSDGGNYERALSQLSGKSTEDFKLFRDKIEFNYRLGRIYDLSSREEQALKYYQQAIDLGKNEPYSFASNAALWSGMIYENIKNKNRAKIYFNLAINMKDHDFENSIEHRAKEGLKRLGN